MNERLISSIEPDSYERDPKLIEAYFLLGDKRLDVDINFTDFTVGTGISTVDAADTRRVPGATTILYECAHALMQREADRIGRNLEYTLVTINQTMRAWAQTKGSDMFHWDSINDNGVKLVAKKTIKPRVRSGAPLPRTGRR